jgi:type III secretion system FlhB-like substrate exporter
MELEIIDCVYHANYCIYHGLVITHCIPPELYIIELAIVDCIPPELYIMELVILDCIPRELYIMELAIIDFTTQIM